MNRIKLHSTLSGVCLIAGVSAAAAGERPNILWLSIEDTSPYDFGCWGNEHVSTPNIDGLADLGIRYTQARSVGPQSSPSRSGIITGCYASTYGMDWHRSEVATPADIFFTDRLREAGYFCTNKSKTDYNTRQDHKAMWDVCGGPGATYNNPARGKDQPFFAVFNSMATHMGRIRSFHTDGRRDFAVEGLDPASLSLPPHVPDIQEIRSDFAFHMEGSQDIDKWVGMFLDDLREQGLSENTIIFFFSDHGGCLPRGKGFLYETGVLVPLVVYLPPKWRHLAGGASSPVDRLVGFPDLAPTVLSLAGIEPPSYMQGRAFLGEYEAAPKQYEFGLKANQAGHYIPERSVTDGRYKFVARYIPYKHDALMNAYQWGMPGNIGWDALYLSGSCFSPVCAAPFEQNRAEMFFDLAADPYEIDNLVDDPRYASEVARLRGELSRFLRETKDLGFFLRSQRGGPTPLYEMVRNEGYDFEELYGLVELTARVTLDDLPRLVQCLASPRKEIRYWSAVGICELVCKGALRDVPDEFVRLLYSADAEASEEVAYALTLVGRHAEAIEQMMETRRMTALELISIRPGADSMFDESSLVQLHRIAESSTPSSQDENQLPISARKVLINLRRLPAIELWGEEYYEEGLRINTDRRKLIPDPYMPRSR